MYNKKLFNNGLLVAILLLSLASIIAPTSSWVYQDGTPEDTKFEKFGPRADRLRIQLYSTADNEWQALADGYIDTTDTPLTPYWYDLFTNPPYNETINVIGYGPELGFFMLDINNDNTASSPVYPNPCSVLSFRQAIACLVDRSWLDTIIGLGRYLPIWVPMSPALGKYYFNIPNPYPYDPAMAGTLLDADGFPVNPATGWRFWDRNNDGIEQPDEYLELKFVIRSDHTHLRAVGDLIANELERVGVRVTRIYATALEAYIIVMVNRDFHLYIGYYDIVKPDPYYLYNFFHSSMIPYPNYNSVNDTEYDYWAEILMYAATQDEAVDASHNAQRVFVEKSFKIPLWVYLGYKAMYRRCTGGTAGNPVFPDDGENQYRNQYWQGTFNIMASGIDNFWSFLNMHPTGYAYGDGENMTIRHGFALPELTSLNPIYASSPQDWQVLNLIYDRLIRRDPSNIAEWMPWIAKNFTISTYNHTIYGECTKVTITLRTDVTWQDGTPLTTADVEFTLVDLDDMLQELGYPPPSWYNNVADILDLKIFDPYNFEILFDIKSYWALSWIDCTPILPKHIWKPFLEPSPTIVDPTGFAPDPNLIGSGPWRLKEYVTQSHILMVANKASSVVQTNLPSSKPIHSPYGYFEFYPVYADIHFTPLYEYRHKIPPDYRSVPFNVTLENLIREAIVVWNVTAVDLSNPVLSEWNKTWPESSWPYYLTDWIDNGDRQLGPSDIISMVWDNSTILEWYHVKVLLYMPPGPIIMRLNPVVIVNKYLYIDDLVEEPTVVYLKPEEPHKQQRQFQVSVGLHTIKVAAHIKEPNWDSWKLHCTWINYTFTIWVTIKADIVGSTLYDDIGLPNYPYKRQLPSPDFKVDIKDIGYVAKAFGSYPGHERWLPCADVTCDYKIDIRDIATVARYFGWYG